MKNLHEILDGEIWAKEFIARVQDKTINPENLDDVRSWFQNAIMAGSDHGLPVNGDHAEYLIEQDANLKKNIQ